MTPPTLPLWCAALAVWGALTLAFLLAACAWLLRDRLTRRVRALSWLARSTPNT